MGTPGRWRISRGQLHLIVFALSLCVTPLILPEVLISPLGARAAWLGTLPALGGALWGIAVAVALARRLHGQRFDRGVVGLIGPFAGGIYLAALAALFVTGAPLQLATFTNSARVDVVPYLPGATALMGAGVGLYLARSGPEAIARLATTLAPIVAVGLVVIYGPLFAEVHFGVFLPLRDLSWRQWHSEPVLACTGIVRGFLGVLVLGPAVAEKPSVGQTLGVAAVAWVLVAASVVLPVAIFDAPLAQLLAAPFLDATSTTTWQWLPVRELAPITLLFWYCIVLIVFATYLWLGVSLMEQLLPFLPRRGTIWVVGAGAATAALLMDLKLGEPVLRSVFMAWNLAVAGLGIVVPTGLCLLPGRRARTTAAGAKGRQIRWREGSAG
jgi:hypothetical protein